MLVCIIFPSKSRLNVPSPNQWNERQLHPDILGFLTALIAILLKNDFEFLLTSRSSIFGRLLEEFDVTNELRPEEVAIKSDKKVTWKCRQCQERYEMSVADRTHRFKSCPKCPGHPRLTQARPDLAKEFDLELNPRASLAQVTTGSTSSKHWICKTCKHKFQAGKLRQCILRTFVYSDSSTKLHNFRECF